MVSLSVRRWMGEKESAAAQSQSSGRPVVPATPMQLQRDAAPRINHAHPPPLHSVPYALLGAAGPVPNSILAFLSLRH